MSYEVSPRLIFNSVCLALAAVLFLNSGAINRFIGARTDSADGSDRLIPDFQSAF